MNKRRPTKVIKKSPAMDIEKQMEIDLKQLDDLLMSQKDKHVEKEPGETQGAEDLSSSQIMELLKYQQMVIHHMQQQQIQQASATS